MNKTVNPYNIPRPQIPGILADASSMVYAYFVCFIIVLGFILANPGQMIHWFLLPLILCGVLIGIDAIEWFRGRMDSFDPVGLVGLFGFHFFFIAPLLIALWDYQMAFLIPLDDWRPWLGGMALFNSAGLTIYRISRSWIKIEPNFGQRRIRIPDYQRMNIVLYFALAFTGAMQLSVISRFGGLSGYINQYETIGFDGFGVFFAFSESFPFLLLIGLVLSARQHQNRKSWLAVGIYLLVFFLLRFFIFGGLRGSRSNTIFAMIWAVGVIHLWVRPISRQILSAGVIIGFLFLYLMGFYKALGSEFGSAITNPDRIFQLENETNRTIRVAIISDLSRADVQAYILHNLSVKYPDFDYAWGRTYLAGYTIIIPGFIWENKPPPIEKEGTDALWGPGVYQPGVIVASRVYGLMTEAMLNFGIYIAPLIFVSLGILVGFVRRWHYNLHPDDIFRLWMPFLILFCVTYIVSNSDNNAVFFALRTLMPGLVLLAGSRSQLVNEQPGETNA